MTKKKNLYLYPITARGSDDAKNPYMANLGTILESHYKIVNINKPSNIGIIQIFKLFFKIDVVFFNWVENLPDRKFGKLQTQLLFVLLFLLKIFGKKIIWTMHNKVSHSKTNIELKTKIFRQLLRKANFIFTHSKEGIEYGKKIYDDAKIFYFPHPVSSTEFAVASQATVKYDILIWGMMTPYKGILEFVEYMQKKSIYNFNILIAGKFVSENYFNSVKAYASDNITIINEFVEKSELLEYVSASKIILFTYDNASVLSSGVLADSITFNAHIVGPDTGSFKDLAAEGIVKTYTSFDNLFPILTMLKELDYVSENKITFLKSITWSSYGQFINENLSKK